MLHATELLPCRWRVDGSDCEELRDYVAFFAVDATDGEVAPLRRFAISSTAAARVVGLQLVRLNSERFVRTGELALGIHKAIMPRTTPMEPRLYPQGNYAPHHPDGTSPMLSCSTPVLICASCSCTMLRMLVRSHKRHRDLAGPCPIARL